MSRAKDAKPAKKKKLPNLGVLGASLSI